MKTLLALGTMAASFLLPATAGAVTVGATTVYSPRESNATGVAQAYRFTAQTSGQVDRLSVYLDEASTASRVELGLYSGSASSAATLRGRCVISNPQPNAWNRCSFAAHSVTSGASNWLAVLQPSGSSGRAYYREGRISGGPATYQADASGLSSLPSNWSNGASWSGGYQASIYADQAGSTPPPGGSQPPTADFSISPNPAVRAQATRFAATGTCPDAPCSYAWLHGSATSTDQIGTGNTGTFTYTGPVGSRTVTLRVTDADGQTDTETKTFNLVEISLPTAACANGRDDDNDGLTDLADPGCAGPTDNDESNVVAPPPSSSGFPDASNTGVPAGTSLTASGALTISTAGAVIDGREITGQVVVNAPNVTIRRSRIRSNAMWVIDNNSTGLVVEDSEIHNRPVAGQNNCHNGIGNSGFTVRRTEITGCENAANIGGDNVTFVDNYVHDLDTVGPSYVWGNSPHTDGLQMSPGADNIVVRHNWIDPSPGGGVTAPIIMGVNGSQSNVWIEDNYLDGRGASYAIYANRSASSNVFINRNRMLRGYGYTACVRLGVTVTEFSGNVDHLTGAALSPDNGAGGGCTN